MNEIMIQIRNLEKSFLVGAQQVPVVRGVSLEVDKGDFMIIFGPSGCGKSTLLHSMLGLEPPTKGIVRILEKDLYASTTEDERGDFRKKHIGMIYQQPNWVRALSVVENVAFPLSLLGTPKPEALRKATAMLDAIGMKNWAGYVPSELSSGQQQKIALARGLIINPQLIVADEPTGNLDYKSGQELMELLVKLNTEGRTIVMVSHDLEYLKFAKTAIQMFDGQIVGTYEGKAREKLLSQVQSKRGVDISI